MTARRASTAGALLLGGLLGLAVLFLGLTDRLDLRFLDQQQRLAPVPGESQVVLVDVDTNSVLAFGWPMDPALYAAMADTLSAAGARAIGLDVLLSDRGLSFAGGEAGTGPDPSDALLGQVASEAGMVLAVNVLRRQAPPERLLPPTPPGALAPCDPQPLAFVAPLRPGLREVPVGHVNVAASPVDGVYRSISPCIRVHDGCVRDLASVMAGEGPGGCGQAELIPYPRAFRDFPTLSLYELVAMTGQEDGFARLRDLVHDRYVLVGASDPGVADLGATPASPREPLVTLHANRLDALLTGRAIVAVPSWIPPALGLLFLLPLAWARLPARGWLVVSAGALGLGAALSWLAFRVGGTWLPPSPLALPLALGALSASAMQGWRYLRFNQVLGQAFGRYVSGDVLDWLQSTGGAALDPAAAERRQVTVLFSDIVGYTRLSNGLPPERVLASLRLYLEAMIAIVQRHGGYLDKINGDGLMVVFGAPRPLPDPPAAAVACALAMQQEARRLAGPWAEITDADLQVRIGLATGPAFVGNLGSERYIEYTAIGPVVNLAARLESKAPPGGALLCADTRDALSSPPEGEWVEVDLKGYEAHGPVRAWSIGGGGSPDAAPSAHPR